MSRTTPALDKTARGATANEAGSTRYPPRRLTRALQIGKTAGLVLFVWFLMIPFVAPPAEGTNLLQNGSFDTDTSGWNLH